MKNFYNIITVLEYLFDPDLIFHPDLMMDMCLPTLLILF